MTHSETGETSGRVDVKQMVELCEGTGMTDVGGF